MGSPLVRLATCSPLVAALRGTARLRTARPASIGTGRDTRIFHTSLRLRACARTSLSGLAYCSGPMFRAKRVLGGSRTWRNLGGAAPMTKSPRPSLPCVGGEGCFAPGGARDAGWAPVAVALGPIHRGPKSPFEPSTGQYVYRPPGAPAMLQPSLFSFCLNIFFFEPRSRL